MVCGWVGRGREAGRVTTKTGQDRTSTEAKRLGPTMVRAKEQMQRAGDQGCRTKRSTGLACIFISFGGGCLSGRGGRPCPSFNTPPLPPPPWTTQHRTAPHAGLVAMSDWGVVSAMPSREFPMLRCNLSSHEPGTTIREGVNMWAMLPYLVIRLVLGSVTKHKGAGTGLPARLPACLPTAIGPRPSSTLRPGPPRPQAERAQGNPLDRTAEVDRVRSPPMMDRSVDDDP